MQNRLLGYTVLLLAIAMNAGCVGTTDESHPAYPSASSTWTPQPSNAAGSGAVASSAQSLVSVSLMGAGPAAYLSDAAGRALYVFANDVPGSNTSSCIAACLEKWPVFDAKDPTVGSGLTVSDFTRFQRVDGAWQTAFKGRPLYRFAADAVGTSGDGASGRWYLARDYNVFVAAKTDLIPQGANMPAPYMTNRAGRTVYAFMSDTAATGTKLPVSACADKCLEAWPVWPAPAALDTLILPASVKLSDFGVFERTSAGNTVKQLTYRGYPLYFHTPDVAPGATTGHMSGAWRAIDPATFAATTP